MLAAVILAAGESRRMGRPKGLLAYHGHTFLEHLLETTRHPVVCLTRVVLGADADQIRSQISFDPATVVINPDWTQGQLSSIQAALRSLPAGLADGILLCPVDQPLITANLVAELIERFYSTGKLIVIPTYSGKRGHPVIFSSKLFGELLAAPPDVGARAVVWAHAAEVLEVPTDEEGVVLNLNDPDTLARALGAK